MLDNYFTMREAAEWVGVKYTSFAQTYRDKKISHWNPYGVQVMIEKTCPNLLAWKEAVKALRLRQAEDEK